MILQLMLKNLVKCKIWDLVSCTNNDGRELEYPHTDLETKPTDPGLYNLHWIMLSIVPAVSPILKAPAWMPPTVAGPRTTCKINIGLVLLYILFVCTFYRKVSKSPHLIVGSCIGNQLFSVWLRYTFSNDSHNSDGWLLQCRHGRSSSTGK